mgnify:CR=1 FL=1
MGKTDAWLIGSKAAAAAHAAGAAGWCDAQRALALAPRPCFACTAHMRARTRMPDERSFNPAAGVQTQTME